MYTHSFLSTDVSLFSFVVPHQPTSTLFPYTTLFRSSQVLDVPIRSPPSDVAGPVEAVLGIASERIFDESQSQGPPRSEEHTSELQSRVDLVCRLLLEKKKIETYMLRHHSIMNHLCVF